MQITIKEASRLTGASNQTIRNWIDEEKIESYTGENNVLIVDKKQALLQGTTKLALFNRKGGVSKTTASVLLADWYEMQGIKTLIVDLDPQQNTSITFIPPETLESRPTLLDFMRSPNSQSILSKITYQYSDFIDVIPSHIEMDDDSGKDVSYWLERKKILENHFKKYSIVIFDCPPSLDLYSRLALLTSNYVLIPTQTDMYSYKGYNSLLKKMKEFVELNKYFIDYKSFITSYTNRKITIADTFTDLMVEEYGDNLLKNKLPDFVGFKERQITMENIFKAYPKKDDKQMKKIIPLLEEIDKFIFEQRN